MGHHLIRRNVLETPGTGTDTMSRAMVPGAGDSTWELVLKESEMQGSYLQVGETMYPTPPPGKKSIWTEKMWNKKHLYD